MNYTHNNTHKHTLKENEMRKNIIPALIALIAVAILVAATALMGGSPAHADEVAPDPTETAVEVAEAIAPDNDGTPVRIPRPGDEDYAEVPTTEEHVELVNELLPDSTPPVEDIPTQEEALEQHAADSAAEQDRIDAEVAANPLPETPTNTPVKPGLPKAGN